MLDLYIIYTIKSVYFLKFKVTSNLDFLELIVREEIYLHYSETKNSWLISET